MLIHPRAPFNFSQTLRFVLHRRNGTSKMRQRYVLSNEFSRRISAGGRLRGIKVGSVVLGLAGGFQHDTKIGNGGYGALQLSAPFQ